MLLSFLSNFDLFQSPVKLYFNGRSKHFSFMGIFVSFSIYGFLLFSFINSDLFKKEQPIITTQSLQMSKAEPVNFDSKIILTFAIVDFFGNRYWDPRYFSFVARYTYGSDFIEKELKSCAVEANNQGGRVGTNFNNTMCLINDTFTLEGSVDGSVLVYLAINVLPCNNKTSNNTCKSTEEINEYIDTFPLTKYFALRYHNAKTDLNNYEKPFKWNSEIDTEYISSKVQRAWRLYFKNAEIETDNGWFFSSKSTVSDIMIDKKTTDFRLRARDTDSFFTVALFASKEKYISSRRYQKIPEVLAEISGLTQFFIIIFGVLTRFVIYVETLNKIISKLYVFPKVEKKRKRSKKNSLKKNHKSPQDNNNLNPKNNNTKEMIINNNIDFDTKNNFCEITTKKPKSQEDAIKTNHVFIEITEKKPNKSPKEFSQESSNKIYQSRLEPKLLIDDPIVFEAFSLDKENEIIENQKQIENYDHKLESKTKLASFDQNPIISCEITQKNFPNVQSINITKSTTKSLFSKIIDKSKEISQKFSNRNKSNLKKTKETKNFQLSIFDYLQFLLCKLLRFICQRKLSEFHEIIKLAEKTYKNDMDSMNIVQKNHDLEKLKMLILNEDQLMLFKFLSKPNINISKKNLSSVDATSSSNKITELMIKQSLAGDYFDDAYKRVLKNEENNEVNHRLIQFLDIDIKKSNK